jgi:ketosteroid isomerase-like protein
VERALGRASRIPLAEEWGDFRPVPDEFVDGGDTIVALGRYSGTYKATGKLFEAPFAHVWRSAQDELSATPSTPTHCWPTGR